MTNQRILGGLLLLQGLNILLITQTWFTVEMEINGALASLGSFDAASAYAIAMPSSLLVGAALIVAFLLKGVARSLVIAFASLATLAGAVWLTFQVVQRNVSGLDGQLEKITGIANTHGVESLTVSVSVAPWIWLATCLLSVLAGLYLSANRRGWVSSSTKTRSAQKTRPEIDPIDLWEQQRD